MDGAWSSVPAVEVHPRPEPSRPEVAPRQPGQGPVCREEGQAWGQAPAGEAPCGGQRLTTHTVTTCLTGTRTKQCTFSGLKCQYHMGT